MGRERKASVFRRSSSGRKRAGNRCGTGSRACPCLRTASGLVRDIKTVEFGWPIGMPVCRAVGRGLYEVRSNLAGNRIARVLFYIDKRSRMVLLHGFIKKTQKTPDEDLELARTNKSKHERGIQ